MDKNAMETKEFDIIILGSGPAGLQAAIHAARRKASVLVLGRVPGSSAYNAHIENFCCIHGDSGQNLLKTAHAKAEGTGTSFLTGDVTALTQDDGKFSVQTETGLNLRAKAIILAMGISRNKLGIQGEEEWVGRGISYCVDCDAGFYKDEDVAVVGCGSAAVSGALTLLFYARNVYLICRRLDVTDYLNQRLSESAVRLIQEKEIVSILGDDAISGLLLSDKSELPVKGVFVERGAKGVTALAGGLGVSLDPDTLRYIATNKKQETNIPGLYAAGDICGPPWQVAKAVGEGCVAGLEAAAYVEKR